MHNRIFHDVHIEQDLGIPLSYDAAWKIFNRWPREVRGQRRRLGEKTWQTMPARRSCCYCSQQNCTTRCPFFGLCKKDPVNTEDKIRGIISHAHCEQPRMKGLLRNLNEWYNNRCTTDSNGMLDLTKLGQLKIKYKIPPYEIGKKPRRRNSNENANTGREKIAAKPNSNGARSKRVPNKAKKNTTEKLPENCSSSELYYTIEKQLRNLSVSQSRLKNMSVSLCRLAYSKRNTPKAKQKPRACKFSGIPLVSNSTSESSGNPSSKTSSSGNKSSSKNSKSSKSSKSTKSSNSSKKGKANVSGAASKTIESCNKAQSVKNNNSNRTKKISYIKKSDKETKTSESSDSNGCSIKLVKGLRFADTKKIRLRKAAAASAERGEKQTDSKRVAKANETKDKTKATSLTKPSKLRKGGSSDSSNPNSSSQTSESYRTVILRQSNGDTSNGKIGGQAKPATQVTKKRTDGKVLQSCLSQKSKQKTATTRVDSGIDKSETQRKRATSSSSGENKIRKKAPSLRISKTTIAIPPKKPTKSKCNMLLKREKSKSSADKYKDHLKRRI